MPATREHRIEIKGQDIGHYLRCDRKVPTVADNHEINWHHIFDRLDIVLSTSNELRKHLKRQAKEGASNSNFPVQLTLLIVGLAFIPLFLIALIWMYVECRSPTPDFDSEEAVSDQKKIQLVCMNLLSESRHDHHQLRIQFRKTTQLANDHTTFYFKVQRLSCSDDIEAAVAIAAEEFCDEDDEDDPLVAIEDSGNDGSIPVAIVSHVIEMNELPARSSSADGSDSLPRVDERTPSERLKELERAKEYLTEDEYNQSRERVLRSF